MSLTFIDLFAGIGGFRLALEQLNSECVFTSEWDKDSAKVYFNNFEDMPLGDITKIDESTIPEHDVLCAGFPCQAFSISGKRLGFADTRGTLFFDIERIVKQKKPKVVFLENVKNLLKHDNERTFNTILQKLEELNYQVFFKLLRSSDFGVPQARERVYIVGFRNDLNIKSFKFPEPISETRTVRDILEKHPPENTFIDRDDIVINDHNKTINDVRKPHRVGTISKGGQGERIYSIDASGITLSAFGGGPGAKTGAYLVDGRVRKLTPREAARMQGFPETFILDEKMHKALKQFGDSVSVPVIKKIYESILLSLNSK